MIASVSELDSETKTSNLQIDKHDNNDRVSIKVKDSNLISIFQNTNDNGYCFLEEVETNNKANGELTTNMPQEEEDDDSLYDETFESSFYWDTTSQLTSSPEDNQEESIENDTSHITHHTLNILQITSTKLHQFLISDNTKEEPSSPKTYILDDSILEEEKKEEEHKEEEEDMPFTISNRSINQKNWSYTSVYGEVLESFNEIDNFGDLDSIKDLTLRTPISAVSSIFSNQAQTPQSTSSSRFTSNDEDGELDIVNDNDDDQELKLFQKKPSTGSRLLRKLSRTFSTSSVSSSVSKLEEPPKLADHSKNFPKLRESPSLSKLRHRFSIASFHDNSKPSTEQLYIPRQRPSVAKEAKSRPIILNNSTSMAALKKESMQMTSATRRIPSTGTVVTRKIVHVNSVANLQRAQLSARRNTSMMNTIEDTIGFQGAEADADYAEFKKTYL